MALCLLFVWRYLYLLFAMDILQGTFLAMRCHQCIIDFAMQSYGPDCRLPEENPYLLLCVKPVAGPGPMATATRMPWLAAAAVATGWTVLGPSDVASACAHYAQHSTVQQATSCAAGAAGPSQQAQHDMAQRPAAPTADGVVHCVMLMPCRAAVRGAFPLNGTYFQVCADERWYWFLHVDVYDMCKLCVMHVQCESIATLCLAAYGSVQL